MSEIRKLIPNIPLEPTPQATLYEQLWFKLDGAYERHRKARRSAEQHTYLTDLALQDEAKRTVELTKQRCIGLVEAIAILSAGIMDEEAVQKLCVKRFNARQPKTTRSDG